MLSRIDQRLHHSSRSHIRERLVRLSQSVARILLLQLSTAQIELDPKKIASAKSGPQLLGARTSRPHYV
jgi:hypothetical protein